MKINKKVMCERWVVGGRAGRRAAQARNERMVGGAPAPDASAAPYGRYFISASTTLLVPKGPIGYDSACFIESLVISYSLFLSPDINVHDVYWAIFTAET